VPLTAADRRLLVRCLNHDQAGWREFVDQFAGLIYHVIQNCAHLRRQALRAEDMEDLAADIFAQIVARDFAVLRQFRGESSLAGYLTVIARRICIHHLSQRAAQREVPIGNNRAREAPPPAAAAPPEPEFENAEVVQRLLTRLPPRDRQVVRMFYLEGRTYDEISEELQIPRNSIGPILARARTLLRQDSARS
jgi:RNA polymerase sigma-70 factor (ECF subfamily)